MRRHHWIVLGALALAGAAFFLLRSPEPSAPPAAPTPLPVATVPPEPRAEPKPEPAPAEDRLSLTLLGTTIGRDPARARAHIHDRAKEERFVVGVGETLPGHEDAVVTQIEAGRVRIDQAGRTIELQIDPDARLSQSLKSPSIEDFLAEHGGSPEALGEGLLGTLALSIGARDRQSLYSQARFAPKKDERGQMIGLWATEVKPGSFFDQLGLSRGDVILEVNGARPDTPEGNEKIVELLEKETELRLVIQGPEGPITLVSNTVRPD
jgi:general secretion pathway protein C